MTQVIDEYQLGASATIECECGTHLLKIESEADVYTNSDNTQQCHQTIYLAMFSYGNQKDGFWRRVRIAFKYLKTGKMFRDQICMSPEEATKLYNFLDTVIIK